MKNVKKWHLIALLMMGYDFSAICLHSFLTKEFNSLLYMLRIFAGLVDKAFKNLVYFQALSDYKQ